MVSGFRKREFGAKFHQIVWRAFHKRLSMETAQISSKSVSFLVILKELVLVLLLFSFIRRRKGDVFLDPHSRNRLLKAGPFGEISLDFRVSPLPKPKVHLTWWIQDGCRAAWTHGVTFTLNHAAVCGPQRRQMCTCYTTSSSHCRSWSPFPSQRLKKLA